MRRRRVPRGNATDAAKSIRDGFFNAFKDVLGIRKKPRDKEVRDAFPSKIAVLPATGDGKEEERRSLTEAIHNSLGTSQFVLMKPRAVERRLKILGLQGGDADPAANPAGLAQDLGVDGLLLVDVDRISIVYLAAYAHYEIAITVRLFSLEKNDFVWRYKDSTADRKAGMSLSPLGMFAAAVTSSRVLSEAARLGTMARLATRLAAEIPEPPGSKRPPPQILFAMSNAVDGPFRAGDELKVWMQADRDLDAWFAFPGRAPVGLNEEKPGEYAGRYVVPGRRRPARGNRRDRGHPKE